MEFGHYRIGHKQFPLDEDTRKTKHLQIAQILYGRSSRAVGPVSVCVSPDRNRSSAIFR